MQAVHTEVTPRLDPVSSASPLKSHPDPPVHDGNAKVLNNHADLDTNTTSSTNREADEPKPEARPRSSTGNEQLSKSHLNITGSSEAQTVKMTVASPNIQSEDATVASSGSHTETKTGTVSSIPASGFTTESVASTVDPLSEKVETGKIRQQASSSVVTSPVPVVAIPSFKDFRTTEEDVSVERPATVVTPTLQSGEALRVTETVMSNVSASEEIEKEAMEDMFETVSPTGTTIPFQGGDGVNETETDENETDPQVEEGHADSHPSPDLISQFSTVGFSIQSETEAPQQPDRAANQPPADTVRRQTPGVRGQRVGIHALQ